MKAILDETGTLTVRAENELEAYALDRWADDYFGQQKSTARAAKFIVSPTVERPAANRVAMPKPATTDKPYCSRSGDVNRPLCGECAPYGHCAGI